MNTKTIENQNLKLAIGISSTDKNEIKILNVTLNEETKKFINSFKKPANKIQAFLISGNDKSELDVLETESKTGMTRIFKCKLKKGQAGKFGVNVNLLISEVWQNDTKLFCYPITLHANNVTENEIVNPEIQSLFDFKQPVKKLRRVK